MAVVDRACLRMLELLDKVQRHRRPQTRADFTAHHALAQRLAVALGTRHAGQTPGGGAQRGRAGGQGLAARGQAVRGRRDAVHVKSRGGLGHGCLRWWGWNPGPAVCAA